MPDPSDQDPFTTLGLPARFDLSPEAIRRAHMARMGTVHPDVAGASPTDETQVARLNQARGVLEDPERRASALLARVGGPSKEQDKSLPAGFLMEIMETREGVEAAVASKDALSSDRWRAWAGEQRRGYAAAVGGMFAALGDPPAREALVAIRTRLNAWRYIERLIEQLDPGYDPARADFR